MVLTLSTVVAEFTPKARVLPARDLTKICMVRKRKKKENKKRFADASYYSQEKKIYSQKKGRVAGGGVCKPKSGTSSGVYIWCGDPLLHSCAIKHCLSSPLIPYISKASYHLYNEDIHK
jgi:hypothetical protein